MPVLLDGDRALAERLNELLFAAFFVENLNLADKQVLLDTGKRAGLEERDILTMLDSDQFAAGVRADELEAERMGVAGAPFFIFANGAAASGALPVEEFLAILKNAARASANGTGLCGPDGCRLN